MAIASLLQAQALASLSTWPGWIPLSALAAIFGASTAAGPWLLRGVMHRRSRNVRQMPNIILPPSARDRPGRGSPKNRTPVSRLGWKRVLLAAFFFAVGGASGVIASRGSSASATFGPSRPTYISAKPASWVTFDSVTDDARVGDERHFLRARGLSTDTTAYLDEVAASGSVIVVAAYFDNDAASNLDLSAQSTRMRFVIPKATGTALHIQAYISASNSRPRQIWAQVEVSSARPIRLTYIAGSARLYSNYIHGFDRLSDGVVNTGTLIGTGGPDGVVPGASQFSGYVTIRVRAQSRPTQ